MFPSMPLNVIVDDLRSTRSVELTIENILDERLVAPPVRNGVLLLIFFSLFVFPAPFPKTS